MNTRKKNQDKEEKYEITQKRKPANNESHSIHQKVTKLKPKTPTTMKFTSIIFSFIIIAAAAAATTTSFASEVPEDRSGGDVVVPPASQSGSGTRYLRASTTSSSVENDIASGGRSLATCDGKYAVRRVAARCVVGDQAKDNIQIEMNVRPAWLSTTKNWDPYTFTYRPTLRTTTMVGRTRSTSFQVRTTMIT